MIFHETNPITLKQESFIIRYHCFNLNQYITLIILLSDTFIQILIFLITTFPTSFTQSQIFLITKAKHSYLKSTVPNHSIDILQKILISPLSQHPYSKFIIPNNHSIDILTQNSNITTLPTFLYPVYHS